MRSTMGVTQGFAGFALPRPAEAKAWPKAARRFVARSMLYDARGDAARHS